MQQPIKAQVLVVASWSISLLVWTRESKKKALEEAELEFIIALNRAADTDNSISHL